MKFLRYFSFAPRHVTYQVSVQLQVRCNCNVRMNTFYTWKLYSDIYWNNSGTIALTVELMAWIKVTQYCWHDCKEKTLEQWRNIGETEKVMFLRYFSFAPRHVTHQVAMQLQVQCNCNVRMNTFYTWKVYSNIYWNNLETIALTVELRAWVKVIQYHWHNCKEKMSEKWRNIGENRKSEASQVFFICT